LPAPFGNFTPYSCPSLWRRVTNSFRANIEAAAAGAPFFSVFTASDVRAAHIALKKS